MTVQQETIEILLFELIYSSSNKLKVFIEPGTESGRQLNKKSNASIVNTKVYLILIEHDNSYELDDWTDAILMAKKLIEDLEKEIAHGNLNPNFYKRIRFRLQTCEV